MIFNEQLQYNVQSLIGEFEIIKDYRDDSSRTGVIEIKAQGKRMFIKIHNRLSRWSAEVYAYQNWMKVLSPYVPTLLNTFKGESLGIIISPIKGRTVNEYEIKDMKKLSNIYYLAGKLLRKLHESFKGTYFGTPAVDGTPFEANVPTNPEYYIASSMKNILQSGYDSHIFDNSDKKLVEWCIKNCDVFKGSLPVPTNWDFSPQNWMVDENGVFTGLIDFENMLWGIDVDSFGVIIERYTYDKPSLRQACFDGYGLENNSENQLKIFIASVKVGIADVCYGSNTNNERFERTGKYLLNKLKRTGLSM